MIDDVCPYLAADDADADPNRNEVGNAIGKDHRDAHRKNGREAVGPQYWNKYPDIKIDAVEDEVDDKPSLKPEAA